MSKGFVPERRGFDLRLDGAHQHLEALDTQLSKWKRKAYRRLTKNSANAGEKESWIEIREKPPQEFSLLISDFLHEMRACLDNIVFDLAIAGNRGMPLVPDVAKDIGFPIYGETPFPVKDRIRRFGPAVLGATTIIEGLQPHARGDDYASDPLFHLHELNRFDKHRYLHAVAFAYLALGIGGDNLHVIRFETLGVPPEGFIGATKMARYTVKPVDPRKKMKMNFDFTFDVAFEGSSPVGRKAVLPILTDIYDHVTTEVIPPLRRFIR